MVDLHPLRRRSRHLANLVLLLTGAMLAGCQALTNPVQEGIPASKLDQSYLGTPREEEKTIPLNWLAQRPPDVYRLASGDILGIYAEGILGTRDQPPPVLQPQTGSNLLPAFGYPTPVQEDGSLPLPYIPPGQPLLVKGMTLAEAQQAIVMYYETPHLVDWFRAPRSILIPGTARIIVTLYKQRQTRVQVIRQDGGGTLAIGSSGVVSGSSKRGVAAEVDLPAYQNDVLTALTKTNGLPGLDAVNEVQIRRNGKTAGDDDVVIRIPLRMRPGEPPPFKPSDILLQTGDIIFIEARDTELFYAGGLLPSKQYALPRDYDLRVIDAVALANGPLVNGGFNQNNLSGQIQPTGLGTPNPSRLSIVRRTKNYGQLVIVVDLNKAFRDTRENILIQPGDVLILQQTTVEAFTQYISQTFRFQYLATLVNQAYLQVTSSANLF